MVQPLTGQTIARYRLLEPIGEGGMGVVYRAEDPHLSRAVAVKVLAERFALDTAALRRFFDEARAASALNHPHICTVHDAGEHEGRPYLVMELVQGRTLSAMLADGPLSLDDMLPLAIQLADALAAAHAAGIVHCDIKPGNLMVTGHGLKILDFGLAKALLPDTSTLTHPVTTPGEPGRAGGTVMGTVPYMSPEQVRGDPVDARTDVFSCGATLYEMATGRRAFPGDTLELVVDAVLRRSPARVAASADRGIPDALQGILDKALEKDRTLRYQHISDLKSDLLRLSRDVEARRADPAAPPARVVGRLARVPRRALLAVGGAALAVVAVWIGARGTVAPGGPSVESIAVMPFGNATGDRELEYLTDGLTVRLINTLADVPRLQVKSRAAVFRYKGRTDDPRRLGQELQVEALLTGLVTRRGDRLVVDVELVDAGTGNQFWGRQFDHAAADVFALEDEIARAIAGELTVELAPESEQRLSRRYTSNIKAYQLYLRGAYHANTFRRDGLERAIQFYQEALAIDPDYALAYSGMARALFWFTDWYAPSQEVSPPALDAARRAIAIDDALAEGHAALGLVTLVYAWDWPVAERAFRRALELNPADARTRAYSAWLSAALGRRDEAVAEAIRAERADPLSTEAVAIAALAHYLGRRYDLAETYCRQVLEIDPSFTWAHIILGRALQAAGHDLEAIPPLEQARTLEPRLSEAIAAAGHAYARAGRVADARAALTTLHELSKTQYVSPMDMATVHAGLGEARETLDWLERAYARRSYLMPFIDALPYFDAFDAEPRFQALLARLELPARSAAASP